MKQRAISLNPEGREVVKITYPGIQKRHQAWLIEPMRFVTLDEARAEARFRTAFVPFVKERAA